MRSRRAPLGLPAAHSFIRLKKVTAPTRSNIRITTAPKPPPADVPLAWTKVGTNVAINASRFMHAILPA